MKIDKLHKKILNDHGLGITNVYEVSYGNRTHVYGGCKVCANSIDEAIQIAERVTTAEEINSGIKRDDEINRVEIHCSLVFYDRIPKDKK